MRIDKIENGIVIDHIKSGQAMELYKMLGLEKLDCQVAIIKNAESGKRHYREHRKWHERRNISKSDKSNACKNRKAHQRD